MINNFGEWLKEALLESGITQRELANRLDLCETSISRYVNGRHVPRQPLLDDLLYELGYHVAFVKDGAKE